MKNIVRLNLISMKNKFKINMDSVFSFFLKYLGFFFALGEFTYSTKHYCIKCAHCIYIYLKKTYQKFFIHNSSGMVFLLVRETKVSHFLYNKRKFPDLVYKTGNYAGQDFIVISINQFKPFFGVFI